MFIDGSRYRFAFQQMVYSRAIVVIRHVYIILFHHDIEILQKSHGRAFFKCDPPCFFNETLRKMLSFGEGVDVQAKDLMGHELLVLKRSTITVPVIITDIITTMRKSRQLRAIMIISIGSMGLDAHHATSTTQV